MLSLPLMANHTLYMQRCLQLAAEGAGTTAPNPMVGAVLVYEGRIIGEGYHRQYGFAHAEVNCINSVAAEDEHLIPSSTIYVSLEPCAHFGKTPPCADLIIQKKIPRVVVGCRDPFKEVDGKGIEKLLNAGVEVITGVLEEECRLLNQRFFTFYTQQRPYVLLKWAQTAEGNMAYPHNVDANAAEAQRLFITNPVTNKLVHKWRSHEAGILVGTNTALLDDPALDNRLWYGPGPVRMVVDMPLKLPQTLKLFNGQRKTIVFNSIKEEEAGNIVYCKVNSNDNLVEQILNTCHRLRILSLMVEGGPALLNSFIDAGRWDEARVITNDTLFIGEGLPAPRLRGYRFSHSEKIFSDKIDYFLPA